MLIHIIKKLDEPVYWSTMDEWTYEPGYARKFTTMADLLSFTEESGRKRKFFVFEVRSFDSSLISEAEAKAHKAFMERRAASALIEYSNDCSRVDAASIQEGANGR